MAASGAQHLSTGKINLGVLRDHYRRELLECLDKCIGSKALVWDDALTGPFGLVAEYSLLKEHDVEKMFPLRPSALPQTSVQNVIFVTRPKLDLMEQIAQNLLKEDQRGGFRKEYHIIFVPRKSLLCEKKLKECGVHGSLTNIEEFNLALVPFDYDVLSMEMETSFRECYVENDFTSMFYAAQSLMTLQSLYGIIPNIYGKGDCAKHVVEMMLRMRRELGGQEPQITTQIDNLFIIDRNVDLLTPILTQLTYEGLIDETFGINNTSVKLPPEKFISNSQKEGGPQEVPTEPKMFILNSNNELYADLRDKNFSAVGSIVSKKAKFITAQFDERHTAKTVGEVKDFVTKLPHLQLARASLATHTSIAELIKEATDSDEFMDCLRCQQAKEKVGSTKKVVPSVLACRLSPTANDIDPDMPSHNTLANQEFFKGEETDKVSPYIEDCLAREEPLIKVLRLICIQSYCNNGLKPKVMEYYKREIIQTYGFQHVITLMNLEKAGLLRPHTTRNYNIIRKTLRLTMDDINEMAPNDISYVYSGYAPLSVRLAQQLARPGWRSITEVLNQLPGATIEEIQQIPVALRKRRGSVSSSHSSIGDQKATLVFFLGGVTFAEISAFRFLAQQDDGSEYIIASTKLINGKTFIKPLLHLEPNATLVDSTFYRGTASSYGGLSGAQGGTDYVIAATKLINGNTLIDTLINKKEATKLNPF